ncbi:MAG TPA: hypothetical protein VGC79_06275 [Polyangiaceae bacterium]
MRLPGASRLRTLAALGALAALVLCSPPRAARAETAAPADATTVPSVSADLAQVRAELSRQGGELAALKAKENERARAPLPVRASGYLQVDFVPYAQASQNEINYSTGAPLNQNRFTLRRGHLRFEADHGLLGAALEIDANTTHGLQVRPIAAELTLHYPERPDPGSPSIALSVGLIKIPFGFEVPERDVVRPFLERSTVARALFPGEFDLGARVRGQYRFLDLTVAVMNGHPIGDRTFPALAPNARKEIVARLALSTNVSPNVAFAVGVSGDTGNGFHEGTPTTKDQLVWRDDNGDGIVQATEVQLIPGSSASASEQFHRFAVGADARLVLRFLSHWETNLRAEVMRASNLDRGLEVADPVGAGYDLRELGWYVGVTQELTSWGLVGVRYDRYDPDQDAREQQAAQVVPRDRSYSTLALLAMLRYDSARLACEYDLNRNPLGRDSNGAPTNLESDVFTIRAQVQF